jgi:hypothetical protein
MRSPVLCPHPGAPCPFRNNALEWASLYARPCNKLKPHPCYTQLGGGGTDAGTPPIVMDAEITVSLLVELFGRIRHDLPRANFWSLSNRQLHSLDTQSTSILSCLTALLVSADPPSLSDMARHACHMLCLLPDMRHAGDTPSLLSTPDDYFLNTYKSRYFTHIPENIRDTLRIKWTLGDGSCMLNAVLLLTGRRPSLGGGDVPGMRTLRLALALQHLIDYDRLAKCVVEPCTPARIYPYVARMAHPYAYLGQLNAAMLARLIDREIWIISPSARERQGVTGRYPPLRNTASPPLVVTWGPYTPRDMDSSHVIDIQAVHDRLEPARLQHFLAVDYPQGRDITPMRPRTYPAWSRHRLPHEVPDTPLVVNPAIDILSEDELEQPLPGCIPSAPPKRKYGSSPPTPADGEAATSVVASSGPTHKRSKPQPSTTPLPVKPGPSVLPHPRPSPTPAYSASSTTGSQEPSKKRGTVQLSIREAFGGTKRRKQPHASGARTGPNTTNSPPDDVPAVGPKLKLLTFNTRGLYSGKTDVLDVLATYKPHLAVITETKIPYSQRCSKYIRRGYPGYHPWVSCSEQKRGGVQLLIHDDLLAAATLRHWPTHPGLGGYVQYTTIYLPSSTPFHIFAVYAPSDRPDTLRSVYDPDMYYDPCQ